MSQHQNKCKLWQPLQTAKAMNMVIVCNLHHAHCMPACYTAMPSSTGPESVAIGSHVCTDADTELSLKA